jgi:hypothetical protein
MQRHATARNVIPSTHAIARFTGLSTRTVDRLRHGGCASPRSMQALMDAFSADFDELFEPADDDPRASVRAV